MGKAELEPDFGEGLLEGLREALAWKKGSGTTCRSATSTGQGEASRLGSAGSSAPPAPARPGRGQQHPGQRQRGRHRQHHPQQAGR